LEIGIDILGADRRQLLLHGRNRTRPPRLEERLGIERRSAFRADDRVAHQIIIARTAARADALGAPFGFGHGGSLLDEFGSRVRKALTGRAGAPLPQAPPPVKSKHGRAQLSAAAYGPRRPPRQDLDFASRP